MACRGLYVYQSFCRHKTYLLALTFAYLEAIWPAELLSLLILAFRFEILFVSRRESVVFSSSCQFTTSAFRRSKIDCLTTSDGFKFGFLRRVCSTTEGRGTFLFAWQVYVYRRGKQEPLEGGAGTPCIFEQHREQRSRIFHNLYRAHHHPCFSRTGFYWLCHVAAWKNILGSRICKILFSAGRVLSHFPLLSTWLTCPYPKDPHHQQPSFSCPFGKGLDKDFLRLY